MTNNSRKSRVSDIDKVEKSDSREFPAVLLEDLDWFADSPDTGTAGCTCSYCGRQIDQDEIPVRILRDSDNAEAILCEDCEGLLDGSRAAIRLQDHRLFCCRWPADRVPERLSDIG